MSISKQFCAMELSNNYPILGPFNLTSVSMSRFERDRVQIAREVLQIGEFDRGSGALRRFVVC